MKENKIIVHAIIKYKDKYLVTKRSNKETVYKNYWDIPGGLANKGELPKDALVREVKEETNLDIIPAQIIYEDSNFDKKKDMIFIRLVYLVTLKSDIDKIKLDEKEHSEYKLIEDISELKNQKLVPFLKDLFTNKWLYNIIKLIYMEDLWNF